MDDLTSHLNKAHPRTQRTVFLFRPRTRCLHSAEKKQKTQKSHFPADFAAGIFLILFLPFFFFLFVVDFVIIEGGSRTNKPYKGEI